jgi:hypothetical protein
MYGLLDLTSMRGLNPLSIRVVEVEVDWEVVDADVELVEVV